MKKISSYIEIVASSNPRLNAMTKESQLSIQKALSKKYSKVCISIIDDLPALELLVAKRPDLVVLGMKLVLVDESVSYDDSPKVWLSDYLKANDIVFTGSDTLALALEFDKHAAKKIVLDAGLKTARYFTSSIDNPTFKHDLEFPLFVKPTNRGDSKGIDEHSLVYNNADLRAKIISIHAECASDALIEEYLSGQEFSVAVIRHPFSNCLIAMPIEITTPADKNGNCFLSEAVKEADTEIVLPVTDKIARKAVNTLATGVFRALGSRDYGRIDMRLNSLGEPNFIEANLMPGLSDHGYLFRCFDFNKQLSYDSMILSIVSLALDRAHRMPKALLSTVVLTGPEQPNQASVALPIT